MNPNLCLYQFLVTSKEMFSTRLAASFVIQSSGYTCPGSCNKSNPPLIPGFFSYNHNLKALPTCGILEHISQMLPQKLLNKLAFSVERNASALI